jgi:flagellar basal-body rod protein FlgG
LEGLYSAAAGLAAQSKQLNAIGNDLANASTSGYQSERVAFSDLLYNPLEEAGTATQVGAGASARVVGRDEAQGTIKTTGNPLDVAIEGTGFLRVSLPGGATGLTRNGALSVGAEGALTDGDGNLLDPPLKLPAGVAESAIKIAADGTISAAGHTIGRIQLVSVPSPAHLQPASGDLLSVNAQSGEAQPATSARLKQGALEESNVDLGREMTLMVSTERAFQMDSNAIQTESQMLSIANQLRP